MIADFTCRVIDAGTDIEHALVVIAAMSRAAGVSTVLVSMDESEAGRWRTAGPQSPLDAAMSESGTVLIPCYLWLPKRSVESLVQSLTMANPRGPMAMKCRPSGGSKAVAFEPWFLGAFPALLAEIRRPLIADLTEKGTPPFAGLFSLCSSHPNLPVVLELSPDNDLAVVASLADACPNVLIETAGLSLDAIASLINDLGPQRVVFGSGYPARDVHEVYAELMSVVDQHDRASIAFENAARLLNGQWKPG